MVPALKCRAILVASLTGRSSRHRIYGMAHLALDEPDRAEDFQLGLQDGSGSMDNEDHAVGEKRLFCDVLNRGRIASAHEAWECLQIIHSEPV